MSKAKTVRLISKKMQDSLQKSLSEFAIKELNNKMLQKLQEHIDLYLDELVEPYFDCEVTATEDDIKENKMVIKVKYGTKIKKDNTNNGN